MHPVDLQEKLRQLERRQCWHKWIIAGLVVAYLFTASPTFTTAPKWFGGEFVSKRLESGPTKTDISKALSDRNRMVANPTTLLSNSTQMLSNAAETERPSKTALARETQIVQATEFQIVNDRGRVVAAIGASDTGDGTVVLWNREGTVIAVFTADLRGNGALAIANSLERPTVTMGADESDQANGWLSVGSASQASIQSLVLESGVVAIGIVNSKGIVTSLLGSSETGNGVSKLLNSSGNVTVDAGATEDGNGELNIFDASGGIAAAVGYVKSENVHGGVLGVFNADGLPVASMYSDERAHGALTFDGGKFAAYVDDNGNGVAETRDESGLLRWSSEMEPGGSGGTSSGLMGDFDGDGDVDFTDFLTFAGNFGKAIDDQTDMN